MCADEATMNGDIQGISKSPSQSQVELPGAYVTTDKVNHPEHSRSSSSVLDDNLIELAAGKERSFDPKDLLILKMKIHLIFRRHHHMKVFQTI